MECTLDIYTDYLIGSTGQTSATGLSRLYAGKLSHDSVTRWLSSVYLDSKTLWQQAKPLIRAGEQNLSEPDFAVLIVDDSIVAKPHTDANAMITTHYDHSQGRYVRGLNFVSLLYQSPALCVPVAAELIEKTKPHTDPKTGQEKFKSPVTKNEYLRKMLKTAHSQVSYRYLLADSWYACKENMQAVLALGRHFIFALESSRTVALSQQDRLQGRFVALSALDFPDKAPLCVCLRSVSPPVLIVRQVFTNQDGSQGCLYLVSSDTELDYGQMTAIYQRRWNVEQYHKSLKQNASMGKSPAKTPGTQANHFFSAILAYIKLEALKIKYAIGHFQLKAQLYLAGLKAMQNHLNLFRA
jgi:DDE superfamily endonuclease